MPSIINEESSMNEITDSSVPNISPYKESNYQSNASLLPQVQQLKVSASPRPLKITLPLPQDNQAPESSRLASENSAVCMTEMVSPFRNMDLSRFSPVKPVAEGDGWEINPIKVSRV